MQFFFRNCTHMLTRTQAKKFEDTFLVKIASKGTSLKTNNDTFNCNIHLTVRVCTTKRFFSEHVFIKISYCVLKNYDPENEKKNRSFLTFVA